MTDSKFFFDTSTWISHLDSSEGGQIRDIVMSNATIYTSVLTLFEVKRKLLKDTLHIEKIDEAINNILTRSILIEISPEISLSASEYSFQKKLGAIDAIIYASSQIHSCTLITFDNDFRDLENVKVLKGVE